MLGNFSFGDYFKKEAIAWAWKFLTKELKIPSNKLWVSVYHDDKEAKEVWLEDIKIDPKKLVELGDHSNFWPADAKENGPNGPCGPCSEIFYDYGSNKKCKAKHCDPSCDCGRFSEIWNLVFTQYNRKDGGVLEPLPSKNIDTGMGLERLAAVMQGKHNNFETDLFAPILKAIDAHMTFTKSKGERNERYVIADHMRAIVFGITDGVIPSNEGRGYVIRKLIIDATEIALTAGNTKPTIFKLVPSVIKAMGKAYPGLKQREVPEIIKNVEESFIKTRKQRIPELEKELVKLDIDKPFTDKKILSKAGEIYFTYHDTYGLPLVTISSTSTGLGIDSNTDKHIIDFYYTPRMEEQKKRSRSSSKISGDVFAGTNLDLDVPKTKFTGYDHVGGKVKILKLFVKDKETKEAEIGNGVQVILNQTPFYAEAGGQIGDSGYITTKKAKVRIEDTQKINDIYIHIGTVEDGTIKVNDKVEATINQQRREAIMCNHTATHLLQSALRKILGSHVQQQGSLVAEDRLRFDFTHPKAISKDELLKIENCVNDCIRACDPVTKEVLSIEEAKKKGALAFFAEKYGEKVCVVSISDYSKEFCGGTHLKSTGEILTFIIKSENSVAQGIRRIEAFTGKFAQEYARKREIQIKEQAENQKDRLKLKERKKEQNLIKFKAIKEELTADLEVQEKCDDIYIYTRSFTDVDMNMLRKIYDFIKQKLPSSIIILGAKSSQNASILIASSEDAIKKGYKANELIKVVAKKINGSGGGRPQMAQAGGKNVQRLDEALDQLYENLLQRKLKK